VRRGAQRNAADDDELALAEEFAALEARDQQRRDREQLATREGRQWVWERLERAGLFDQIRGELGEVMVRLGRREEGLELLARVQQHPELFFQMWSEALKRRKQRAEEWDAARKSRRRRKETETR
jgi:hypothetical protein